MTDLTRFLKFFFKIPKFGDFYSSFYWLITDWFSDLIQKNLAEYNNSPPEQLNEYW